MTVSSITNLANTGGSGSTQQLSANLNTFLTLLTTQLQYQDPLNPMDTADFTNQLVLYTQAEQQIKTNDKLTDLISVQRGTIGTQALGYIGMDVGYLGNDLYTTDVAEDHPILYSLAGDSATFSIEVRDKDNNTIRKLEGEGTAGNHELVWDGKNNNGETVPPGSYTVKITAKDKTGNNVNVQTVVNSTVTGLESDGNGSVNLILEGDRMIALSSIFSVWKPSAATPNTNTQS